MKKYICEIEFRYNDIPTFLETSSIFQKKITIGIYDDIDIAIENGNNALKTLSEKGFEIRPNDKFIKGKFLFVSNCCYPTKGISYFASIITLSFEDISSVIDELYKAKERFEFFKKSNLKEYEK